MTVKGPGNSAQKAAIPRPNRGMAAKGFLKGQPPVTSPYFRVRRMTFLQVALQVRLCRAWWR